MLTKQKFNLRRKKKAGHDITGSCLERDSSGYLHRVGQPSREGEGSERLRAVLQ